jgi:hypothetical protein
MSARGALEKTARYKLDCDSGRVGTIEIVCISSSLQSHPDSDQFRHVYMQKECMGINYATSFSRYLLW